AHRRGGAGIPGLNNPIAETILVRSRWNRAAPGCYRGAEALAGSARNLPNASGWVCRRTRETREERMRSRWYFRKTAGSPTARTVVAAPMQWHFGCEDWLAD